MVRAGDDWLPVPPEDLAMKDNPKQPGADAMILYREVSVDETAATVSSYSRIKIFTSAGVKSQADVEIPYDRSHQSIRDVRGRTIRPDGSIVEFDGHTFDKEIAKGQGIKYLAKTFTLPDVQPGSIVEYRFRQQNEAYYWDHSWTIQATLFTRQARFSIKLNDSATLPLRYRSYNLPSTLVPHKEGDHYVLEVQDLPGIEEENLMLPLSTLEARIEFFYVDREQTADETVDQFWNRTGKQWSNEIDRFIDKKKDLAEEVSRVTSPSDPPEVRLRKLYARSQMIRNLDYEDKTEKETKQESIKTNDNVGDVLKHGYGHSLEISYLFIGLARAAGFTAQDVRVAARNRNLFDPPKRSTRELSAELVWVRADSKEYYLDPSARFYPFGLLPWFETATQGIRTSKDGSEMITVPAMTPSQATIVTRADVTIDNSADFSGKLSVDFAGLEAAMKRSDYRDSDATDRTHTFQDEIKGWLPVGATYEDVSVDNWDDIEKPIHVEGTFNIPSLGSGSAQRLLLPIVMFQATEPGWFDSQKRVNAVYFHYPYEKTDDVVWHLPLGFTAQNLPAPQKVHPGPVSYDISVSQQADTVEVKRDLVVNGIIFSKDVYPALRQFFSIVKVNDNARFMLQNSTSAHNN